MICSNCGKENVEGSVLCGFCGAAFEPAYPASTQPGAYGGSPDGSAQWNAGSGGGYGQPYVDAAQPGQQPGQPYMDAAQLGQQPAQSYGAAQPAQPAQPYGAAQPTQAYAAAQPAQPYGAAQPAQPKKNKTMLVVGIIVAAVIVLGGGSVGGYFIYQNMTGDAQATRQPPGDGSSDGSSATADPGAQSGTGTSSGTKTNFTAAFENPYVILDEDEIKITIDLGSGERDSADSYKYSVSCVVENKTDNFFRIEVNDPVGKGYTGSKYSVSIYKEGHYGAGKSTMDFAPGESFASIQFRRDDIDGSVTDFTAKIELQKVGEYSGFAIYNISIAKF